MSPALSTPPIRTLCDYSSSTLSDYMEVDHGQKPTKSDTYIEMSVTQSNRDGTRSRKSSATHSRKNSDSRLWENPAREGATSRDGCRTKSSEKVNVSRSEDRVSSYMDMAMNSSRDDSVVFSDDGSVDSGTRSDSGRTPGAEPRPISRTSSRGRPDADEYIPMNIGATSLGKPCCKSDL